MCYMQARVNDLEQLRADGNELESCDAAQQTLMLIKRAGIHPHFLQDAVQRLLRAMDALVKTRKRWLVT